MVELGSGFEGELPKEVPLLRTAPRPRGEGNLLGGIVEETDTSEQMFSRLRTTLRRDPRKYRYDVTAALLREPVPFSVTKADRLDAYQAGQLLHAIHVKLGVDSEVEEHVLAFDAALFFEHTLNGASVLQPNRGNILVGNRDYPIADIVKALGDDARRFFRAFADDVAAANRAILDGYMPNDPVSVEKHGQLMSVAFERGMEKFPYLAHDSADACLLLSVEERNALAASKRRVLSAVGSNPYKRYAEEDSK